MSFNITSKKAGQNIILAVLLSYSFCDFYVLPLSLKRNDQINHFNKHLLVVHKYHSFKLLVKSNRDSQIMGPSLLSLNNDFKEDPPPSQGKNG